MSVYSLYRDYKGKIHKVITIGINSIDNVSMIVHEDEERQVIITPSEVFNGLITIDGKEIERFKLIGNIN